MPNTTHTIKIIKDTEVGIGWLSFKGLYTEELLEPDPLTVRNIEFYDNSITCGFDIYTVLCNKSKNSKWCIANYATPSYDALTAKNINA